jgi:hypothetical protein
MMGGALKAIQLNTSKLLHHFRSNSFGFKYHPYATFLDKHIEI